MAIKLGNTDINKVYLGSTQINKMYLGSTVVLDAGGVPSFDSGIILNGSFDDATNLTLGSSWSIGGGVATYDAVTSVNELEYALSETLLDATNYTITFDVVSATNFARIGVKATIGGVDTLLISYTSYTVASKTINFTTTGTGTAALRFVGSNSSGNLDFSIDNVKLVIT